MIKITIEDETEVTGVKRKQQLDIRRCSSRF